MTLPTFTPEQLQHVYDRIQLPLRWRLSIDVAKSIADSAEGLEFLSALHRHHLANIPFENLELHYSQKQAINIDAPSLFDKIVVQGTGRGGYCMENNAFFSTILRTLGFKFKINGGRVNNIMTPGYHGPPSYAGIAHHINIVEIEKTRYLVDVGFGPDCVTKPMPLIDGHEQINVKPDHAARLRFDRIPEHENDGKVWIYESRGNSVRPWTPCYCFLDDAELIPADFDIANHWYSTHKKSWFTHRVLVVKAVLSEDNEEVAGWTVLNADQLQKRVNGEQKERLGPFESEEQRVAALGEYLGIKLSDQQRQGILSMSSAIA